MDTILVPTDGSENAGAAVEHAIMLAQHMDAAVHALYVVNVSSYADIEGGIDIGSIQEALESEGSEAVGRVKRRGKTTDVPVTTEVRTGRPVSEIREYAEEIGADLILMGTHGRSGVSRLLLGSVTEAVLRRARIPVLAVPQGSEPPTDGYEGILVATDSSEGSREATEIAIEWASALSAELHGLYVVDSGLAYTDIVERALEGEGASATGEIERMAEAAGVDVTTAVNTGRPHEVICGYASENDLDLIVVGSHGRDVIERAVLGSVSERTVRMADRPVLVVRQPSE